jgi:hypothetical protein
MCGVSGVNERLMLDLSSLTVPIIDMMGTIADGMDSLNM